MDEAHLVADLDFLMHRIVLNEAQDSKYFIMLVGTHSVVRVL
jgi:hypothetical protein